MPRPRFVRLVDEVRRQRPELSMTAAETAIAAGKILAGGRPLDKPESLVRRGCSIVVTSSRPLRGEEKLGHLLDRFALPVADRTCLDVGAAAGGFTRALLDRGARRVYAVDVGHGQLTGALRQDDRVVNLEATNVAALGPGNLPEALGGVSIDVSYLSLSQAAGCLARLSYADGAWLAGLIKPMFELGRAELPTTPAEFAEAVQRAVTGVEDAGWAVRETVESAVRGANGAVEFFVVAVRE